MKGLMSFITAFCSCAVLLGGLYLLKPSSVTEKSVKYLFSLIFICCIVSSFALIRFDSIDYGHYVTAQSSNEEVLSRQAAELTFSKALENQKINFSKITVCTDKSEDGSIIINKVIVFSSDLPDRIYEALGGKTAEYEIEVVYE